MIQPSMETDLDIFINVIVCITAQNHALRDELARMKRGDFTEEEASSLQKQFDDRRAILDHYKMLEMEDS